MNGLLLYGVPWGEICNLLRVGSTLAQTYSDSENRRAKFGDMSVLPQ